MTHREMHDGRSDGLIPLESLSLDQVSTFRDLLQAMGKTAFAGRQLGEAFEILMEVSRNESCHLVLTLSGAMTIAKQGSIICEMIDRGLVAAVVATGALIAHGLTESIGLTHYRAHPHQTDEELFHKGYNRIYDTLEMEANLNDVEQLVRYVLSETKPIDGTWSSSRLCRALGKELHVRNEGTGILKSAFEQNVPVFIPAFTDSEIGLDVSTWSMQQMCQNSGWDPATLSPEDLFQAIPPFNPFLDLQEYARLIGTAKQLAILTIGGGVPRNWAQQVSPYYDITNDRLQAELKTPRFQYGVRICPEPVHWGGLSGCTYSEGVSWGKFVSPEDGGRYAEVYSDATAVWPLLMKAIFETLDAR